MDFALGWLATRPSVPVVQVGAYIGDTVNDLPEERDFYGLGTDPAVYGHPEWLSQLGSPRSASH